MAEIKLPVDTKRPTGSRSATRLRASGQVPAVVYGQGTDSTPVSVAWPELRAALTTEAGLNALLDLQINGESRLAIVKDMQRDPIRGSVTHLDFLLIDRDEMLTVEVPILVEGEALEVTREGGITDHMLFSLEVQARPSDIPNDLVVDISELTLGEAIRVEDIVLPKGVTTEVDPEEPVVITMVPAAEVEPEVAEDEEVEGEEGEAVEGEDAAEGDADSD